MIRSLAVVTVLLIQVPAVSGYFKGMEDFSGTVHYGWAGYGIGIAYAQIGTIIGLILAWVIAYGIKAITKD